MASHSVINLYVDADVERQAAGILANIGLTVNDAFDLLLRQICAQRALPFNVADCHYEPKPESRALIERIENGTEELHSFDTWEEAKVWLNA